MKAVKVEWRKTIRGWIFISFYKLDSQLHTMLAEVRKKNDGRYQYSFKEPYFKWENWTGTPNQQGVFDTLEDCQKFVESFYTN